MMLGASRKQPIELLDYDVDFSQWIPDDDQILSVETYVVPTGSLKILAYSLKGKTISVWCSEGESGQTYKVTVVAATNQGRVKEVDFRIKLKDV